MNIVMLDDERISLAVLKNHVGKLEDTHGFAFTHPSDALRWSAANEVDAVIIDYMLPEMDGLAFVGRFRLLPGKADVPMIMVSGSRDTELQRRAHLAGVRVFFTKPLDVTASAQAPGRDARAALQPEEPPRNGLLGPHKPYHGQTNALTWRSTSSGRSSITKCRASATRTSLALRECPPRAARRTSRAGSGRPRPTGSASAPRCARAAA